MLPFSSWPVTSAPAQPHAVRTDRNRLQPLDARISAAGWWDSRSVVLSSHVSASVYAGWAVLSPTSVWTAATVGWPVAAVTQLAPMETTAGKAELSIAVSGSASALNPYAVLGE